MYGKWVCFAVLNLIILTYSTPGGFHHDYHGGRDKPTWSQDWHGWGHDWYSGHTTQRARTKVKTTSASSPVESRSSITPPQPTISDVDIRLGEVITTTDAPSSQSTQAEQDRQTLGAFGPGPKNTEASVETATVKAIPVASNSQFVKAEALADEQTLKAFAPGPEDGETSVAAADVKTIPVAPSTQLVKAEALANQQTLEAFAPGPEEGETKVAAADVKTIPVASSSQLVKAEGNQQKLQAFAPSLEDGETSVGAASEKNNLAWQSLKRLVGSSFQSIQDLTEQQKADALYKAQSFGPDGEYEDVKRLLDAPTVKTEDSGLEAKPDGKTRLWHVAVYQKRVNMNGHYKHVCGGSLVKEYIIVSAGHCFWSLLGVQLHPNLFRVAAGKIHSGYDDPRDTAAQFSDVEKITTTKMEEPCYQPDLAVINLVTPFKYTDAVKPVCVNFFWDHEKQLKEGNFGTVASWAVYEDGECLPKPSETLNWLSLPFVEAKRCQVGTSSKTIGRDRICAGEMKNTTQCPIDSGNGLVFYQDNVPYLRGVTTDIPIDARCTDFYTRSFSNIIISGNYLAVLLKQINDYLNQEECEDLYKTNQTEAPKTEAPDYGEGDSESVSGQQFGIQSIGSSPVPVLEGTSAPAYQWHVGIYSKAWVPFMQICGGTLVKRDFVISAAHCFWDDTAGQQLASQFAVATGKLFRPWNSTQDTYAQHSNVSRIILPVRFRGSATSFQDDIAILHLSTPFTYTPGVQPACVSFNITFEKKQLQPLTRGTVLGWGLTEENGRPSQRLNYINLPYVDVEDCFTKSDPAFMKFITSDKICAGDTYSGLALCRGDSGGGYVVDSGAPYLHGVASTAAGNQNLCNAFAIAAITSTYSHRGFIRDNIPDIEKECADTAGTESYVGGTGNVGTGNAGTGNAGAGDVRTGNMGTGDVRTGDMGSTVGPTGNMGSTGNVGTGNVGSPGIVVPNQGLNVIGGTLGDAGSATPVFSQLPYYPNHFVLGWGLTEENGRPSQRLNYIDLPYVDVEDCFTKSEPAFMKFITSDKICAGDTYRGLALCRGDSGGGYVVDSGAPYLHDVASTAAGNQNLCNAFAIAAITSTYSHRGFIRDNIPDIEKECADTAGTESYVGGTGNVGTGNAGTGNVGTGNAGSGNVGAGDVRTGNMGTGDVRTGDMGSTVGPTGNMGSTGNVGTGNVGSPGIVVPNQGLNVIGGTLGDAGIATPVFSQLPYYPNHFVCNCNCKT